MGATPAARVSILGLPVDLVDMDEAVGRLVAAVEEHRAAGSPGLRVATLNPEMVMRARRSPPLGAALRRAGLVIPDGVGLVAALRRRGHLAGRVTGADLVDRYAPHAARLGHRLALVGARPGIAARAAKELVRRHPGLVVAATDSGEPSPALIGRVAAARADVVLAAYSMEVQAVFLDEHLDACGAGVGIGVGGTLDYLAGKVRRAPAPVRELGLEWLWRLARQPWRLRRQLDLPRFWWRARREA